MHEKLKSAFLIIALLAGWAVLIALVLLHLRVSAESHQPPTQKPDRGRIGGRLHVTPLRHEHSDICGKTGHRQKNHQRNLGQGDYLAGVVPAIAAYRS